MAQTLKQIEKQIDKHYKVIYAFVNDYCKSEKDKKEFYDSFNKIIELNLTAEKLH